MDSSLLKDKIYEKLSEKKAFDLEVIDLAQKSTLADFFVIASGASRMQVKSLADEIDDYCSKEYDLQPKRISGFNEGRWVLMDYGTVVVHLFHPEERQHYNLEQLWQERPLSEYIDPAE